MNNSCESKLAHPCVWGSICGPWIVLLLLLDLPAALQAQFTYTINNGTITITGYTGPGGAVTIPSTIDGLPVTTIGDSAFAFCPLSSVTIPNSVISIGDWAFFDCRSLTSVMLGDHVTSIGVSAFDTCISLTSVTIPNSVTNIGDHAFTECSSLNAITVDTLNPAYSSFNGALLDKNQTTLLQCPANKVGSYTIPSSVTTIGSWAFIYCSRLTRVIIPDSVTI